MRFFRLLFAALMLPLVLVVSNAQPTAPAPSPGTYILPNATLPFIPGQHIYQAGAMGSGIAYAGGNEFWGITDRGPNVDSGDNMVFPIPGYNTRLFKLRLSPNGIVTIVDSLYLRRPGGGPTSGLPLPAPYNTGIGVPYDAAFNVLSSDDWGFDAEGLVRTPTGSFWMCDEYGVSIASLDANGQVIERVLPQPTNGLPDILKRRRGNRGFEGVTVAPNGKVYAIMQSGMQNSYENTASANDDAGEQTEVLRLVEWDPATRQSQMFVYLMNSGYPVSGGNGMRRRDVKMGDIVAINNDEFLVMEHGERKSQSVKRIYKISLVGATPITTETYQPSPGVFKSLEELTRTEVSTIAGIVPVQKTFILDMLNPGNGNPAWPAGQDKPEGIVILDPLTIAVSTDNDFGVNSPNEDGNIVFTGKETIFQVYGLRTPLNLQIGARANVITSGNAPVTSSTEFFQKDFQCAGETAINQPLLITNPSNTDLVVYGIDVYRTDSVYGQGVPAYALLRDQAKRPIPSMDYLITDNPASAPRPVNPMIDLPFVIPPGGSRTIYVNFLPQLPGKRFARAFIRTNGINFFSTDTTLASPIYGSITPRYGLLTFDLFGRGLGARPTDQVDGLKPPAPVTFAATGIGSTATQTVRIYNTGACELRIDRKKFQIIAGDVKEFKILDAFSGTAFDQTNDTWLIGPGAWADVTLSFTPSRSGSRRATIWMQTNDSTLIVPELTERGAYYWDITGVGTAGLEARDAAFSPAVIGGAVADQATAAGMVENTTHDLIYVNKMEIVGPDASEFSMDRAKPWPTVPFAVLPGKTMHFSVVHMPAPGSQPGPRTAQLQLSLSNGQSITINLVGEAGTRTLNVSPSSLFDNVSVAVGKVARQTVMITNNGTLPLKLGTTTITGTTATDYTLGRLPRLVLAPGQTELLEVTYRPLNKGVSSAMLNITSNATTSAAVVTLGGTATKIAPNSDGSNGISGVESSNSNGNGMSLSTVAPNPAHDMAAVHFNITTQTAVDLKLLDAIGQEVMVLASGESMAGKHTVRFSVASLPAGVYYCTLAAAGQTLTTQVVVR